MSKRFRVQLIVGVLTGALIVYFWLLAVPRVHPDRLR